MTPQLQTLLNAATSFRSALPAQLDLTELYLWSVYYGVTDSDKTIFDAAADVMQLTAEQRQMIRCFALAKKNGQDTNFAGLKTVVTNNLNVSGALIPEGRTAAAEDYIHFRGLGVL